MQVQPTSAHAPADDRRELERFKQDIDYYESHREALLEQYPEQWIAIFNQQVIGTDTDLRRLLTAIKRTGVSPTRALVKQLTTKEELLILPL